MIVKCYWRMSCTLLLIIVMLATSCSQEQAKNPDKLDKTIRFGLASVPLTLDPRFASDAASVRLIRLIYLQLVDFNQHSLPVPALARWRLISNTHYRFTLNNHGRIFHNGERLSAHDVKATYDSVLNPLTKSAHAPSLSMIKSIKVINEDTIDFELHYADKAFPGYLVIGIMPKRLLDNKHNFIANPIGSGPFRFVAWPDRGLLKLSRMHDAQLFEFVHIANPATRALKLRKGEIDMLQNGLPTELIQYLESFPTIVAQRRQGSNFTYLSFNLRNQHLAKLEVRRAIAHAIDRHTLIEKFFGPKTRLANAIFTPEHWAGYEQLVSYEYNPNKARQMLRQAGYSKQAPLRLTYKTTNKPLRVRIATAIQYQLGQVGIQVTLRTYEWATFYSDIRQGNFDLFTLSWVAAKSPDMFRYVYHSSSIPDSKKQQGGANRNAYRDEITDYYIELAEKEQRVKKRIEYYHKIHQRLIDRLPVLPLWYEEHVLLRQHNIIGYTITHDGNFDSLNYVQKLDPALLKDRLNQNQVKKSDATKIDIFDNIDKLLQQLGDFLQQNNQNK